MSPQTDNAVVLRLTEFSETSQITTLFSERNGQLRLIAKGARRSTRKRFAAGLDLLECGEVSFLPPRGDAQLGTLTEWLQRDTFAGLRRAGLRLYGALYAAELVTALTEESDPHAELYHNLVETLRALNDIDRPASCLPVFQANLLDAIGYAPNLTECVSCRGPITTGAPLHFSAGAGGILCQDCEPGYVEKRRIPAHLLETTPADGDPRTWFELLNYHLAHIARHPFKTARQVTAFLGQDRFQSL